METSFWHYMHNDDERLKHQWITHGCSQAGIRQRELSLSFTCNININHRINCHRNFYYSFNLRDYNVVDEELCS